MCIIFNAWWVPPGQPSIENEAHDIEKLLPKTQVSEKFWHSEMNLKIQYITVQDQDGQNNNLTRYLFFN